MPVRMIEGELPFTVTLTVLPQTQPGDGGEVTIESTTGRRTRVALDCRHFRVLRLLIEAYLDDSGVEPKIERHLRGLRTATAIRRAYAAQVNEVALMTADALRKYLVGIRAALELALDEIAGESGSPGGGWSQAVIKTVARRGYQIGAVSFVYVDHTASSFQTAPSTLPPTSMSS